MSLAWNTPPEIAKDFGAREVLCAAEMRKMD
jgi:hypothetical protein